MAAAKPRNRSWRSFFHRRAPIAPFARQQTGRDAGPGLKSLLSNRGPGVRVGGCLRRRTCTQADGVVGTRALLRASTCDVPVCVRTDRASGNTTWVCSRPRRLETVSSLDPAPEPPRYLSGQLQLVRSRCRPGRHVGVRRPCRRRACKLRAVAPPATAAPRSPAVTNEPPGHPRIACVDRLASGSSAPFSGATVRPRARTMMTHSAPHNTDCTPTLQRISVRHPAARGQPLEAPEDSARSFRDPLPARPPGRRA